MPTPAELKTRFWKSLKSDRTVMLGLVSAEKGHTRPMTAQLEGESGPIWFFADRDTELVEKLANGQPASFSFSAKSHDLFASVEGTLQVDQDRAVIDRLWNSFIAAWFKEGKDDPRLVLLRFDPGQAEIWENASNLLAGIKAMLGVDPQADYQDKVAQVKLG
ncbi:MAG: pyridoxamine 5'-phosphate oxidase family protein [Chelatococcus sp.]|uniref:pyridoxamine 5'-phosphate oxidase family protein n=1 Tax=Chelatococcus sp. TaxID=1953771 RepID=UPI0025C2627E|nr:pyridoxamine 5'-phosphate oxidase family protein [Chelatococcus sp.]MBX3538558.1 pyridoxamine 5'-phosphate oxidase family protein [Chelatococcus sp.]